MPASPAILKVTPTDNSRLFKVEKVSLRFSNGEEREFERLTSGSRGAVMIVAITADQQLVLIREYATGLDDYVLTFPKGVIDPGEDALAAANRELQEEAGFAAQKLTALREISAVPSYMTYKLQLVVAEQLYPSKLEGDEPEPLEVRLWPLDRLHELAEEPEFSEGRAIAALLLLQNYLKRPA